MNKRNWKEYNTKLVHNGSINFWLSEETIDNWRYQRRMAKHGRPRIYDDAAIVFCQVIRYVYRLALRQTQGMVQSILNMMQVELTCPNYTLLCRRLPLLDPKVMQTLARVRKSSGPIDIILDSSGLKVYGEGEWKVRQHGWSKRRTWRKIHIGIDRVTQEIVTAELTPKEDTDAKVALRLLENIAKQQPIAIMLGDGAYDDKQIYQKLHELGACPLIPPPRNAAPQQSSLHHPSLDFRDQAIMIIKKLRSIFNLSLEQARKWWRKITKYHQRSKVETAFFRWKTRLGPHLASRNFASQIVEANLKCIILNKML